MIHFLVLSFVGYAIGLWITVRSGKLGVPASPYNHICYAFASLGLVAYFASLVGWLK